MTGEPASAETVVEALVNQYKSDLEVFKLFADQLRQLLELPTLRKLYHSIRWRVKDPEHLKDKLYRQLSASRNRGEAFSITSENLYSRINDLVGVRLLHLHTAEFPAINKTLLALLEEQQYPLLEGPTARVWDDEYQEIYSRMGIQTVRSVRMYTSVHYVIEANMRTKRTAEIQVRTLAEELWGEVDHIVNYPHPSPKPTCREQIKVLARVTSSATRLVDSIVSSHNESTTSQSSTQE